METKRASLADATERRTTEGPLHPYRNHRLPHQVHGRFPRMHPTFASACGAPSGYRMPEMNQIRQRTHVASRPGSILGVFGPENHRKSVELRNATNFGVRDLHGHCGPWKKMSKFGGCDGETYDRGSPLPIPKPPPSTPSARAVSQNAPNFCKRMWGPARVPHTIDERNPNTNAHCVTPGQCFWCFRPRKS